ncbi:helix-turn-helix domain-containing protein [Paenibacillus swuensis]|nr:helix-turn-helix domain-containing protein [Paenibacillus swuensis]
MLSDTKFGGVIFRSSFFRKSLIMVLLITCLPTVMIGLSLHFIGVPRIEQELNRTHQQQLARSTSQMDEQLMQLEVSMSQWAFNPVLGKSLADVDLGEEFTLTRNLYKTLSIMKETNPLIQEVTLYLNKTGLLVSDINGYETVTDSGGQALMEKLMEGERDLYWSKDLVDSPYFGGPAPLNNNKFKYALVHRLSDTNNERFGALIVQINTGKLKSQLQTLGTSGIPLLMDSNGDWLIMNALEPGGAHQIERNLRDEVKAHVLRGDSKPFIYTGKEKRYSVSYRTFTRSGTEWIFASATDVSKISEPVLMMSRLIILVSIVGVVASFVLSWVTSHRIYRPVAQLFRTVSSGKTEDDDEGTHRDELEFIEKRWQSLSSMSRSLEAKIDEQLPSLRESFMLQLIQGHLYYLKENELKERMAYYGWETSGYRFVVIVAQLSGLKNDAGKFKEDEQLLASFAAANIAEEMAANRLQQVHVINFQNMSLGMIAGIPSERTALAKTELVSLSQELADTLSIMLKLQVTVCIGQLSEHLEDMPIQLEEAYQTLKYRNFTGSNQIIEMDELTVHGDYRFQYPFEAEKDLLHAIRLGQEEESLEKLEVFIKEFEHRLEIEFYVHQAMAQLLGNIHQTLLQAGFHVYAIYKGENLYDQLSQLRQTSEILQWFKKKIVIPYIHEINSSYNTQLKQAVKKVIDLINENYMKDMSFEEYADLAGAANISSLSRAFKQTTGINYVDYITQLRIDKSKHLLLETDLKINDIAEQVGYQHSWFNRLFKKSEGITPTQYRNQHRGE